MHFSGNASNQEFVHEPNMAEDAPVFKQEKSFSEHEKTFNSTQIMLLNSDSVKSFSSTQIMSFKESYKASIMD